MRFAKLELAGAPPVELPLHRRMTVVGGASEAERVRLAEALAGRARDGVVWAFDDEDPAEEQVPIGDFAIFGLSPEVQVAMLLRPHDIPVAAQLDSPAQPFEPEPAPAEVDAEAEARNARRADLEERRAQLVARLIPQAGTELETAVAAALTALREAEDSAGAAADDAQRIAAEWDEVATALAATPIPSDEDIAAMEAARAALADRREELACARLEVGRGPVSPEDAARIEHLHSEVQNAQARADRPFPGLAARRRLAEAEEAEAKFLQELGFSSYSAYLLDAVVRPVDPEPLRRLSSAERAVAEAEAAWQELAPIAEALHARQSLVRRAGLLREQAAALLGTDPGDAVAERLADWPESCARLTDSRSELQRVLRVAGGAPGEDPAVAAEAWLAARQAEAAEHTAREAELAGIEAQLAALQRAEAERVVRAEAHRAAAFAAHAAGKAAAESLDSHLAGRLAVHRHVGPIGSLPLILDDTFADLTPAARLGYLTRLAEMSTTVQVVYLTVDPDVLSWAETMPSDEVGMQRPAPITHSVATPPSPAPVEAAPSPAPPAPSYVPPAPAAHTVAAPPAPAPVAPVADSAAATPVRERLCMDCHSAPAVGDCHQCGASFCADHLVRMKRDSRPPLCLSCALVAAGARRGRR